MFHHVAMKFHRGCNEVFTIASQSRCIAWRPTPVSSRNAQNARCRRRATTPLGCVLPSIRMGIARRCSGGRDGRTASSRSSSLHAHPSRTCSRTCEVAGRGHRPHGAWLCVDATRNVRGAHRKRDINRRTPRRGRKHQKEISSGHHERGGFGRHPAVAGFRVGDPSHHQGNRRRHRRRTPGKPRHQASSVRPAMRCWSRSAGASSIR